VPYALSGFGWPVRQKTTASYPSRAAAVYFRDIPANLKILEKAGF